MYYQNRTPEAHQTGLLCKMIDMHSDSVPSPFTLEHPHCMRATHSPLLDLIRTPVWSWRPGAQPRGCSNRWRTSSASTAAVAAPLRRRGQGQSHSLAPAPGGQRASRAAPRHAPSNGGGSHCEASHAALVPRIAFLPPPLKTSAVPSRR